MNLNLTLLVMFFIAGALLLAVGFLVWVHRRMRGALLKASVAGAAVATVVFTLLAELAASASSYLGFVEGCGEHCSNSLAVDVGGTFVTCFVVALVVGAVMQVRRRQR